MGVRQLAAGLDIELDEVTETYVRELAPEAFDIASGHIARGTAAALRFEVSGMKDGNAAVVLEHVTRLRDDLHPDWSRRPPASSTPFLKWLRHRQGSAPHLTCL